MKLSKNFDLREFNCKDKDGTPVPTELMPNVYELAQNLQVLRDHINIPIHINSGYRTEAHNEAVGGSKNSRHLLAEAADITTRDLSPKQLYSIIEKLIQAGEIKQGGLKAYKGFTHYDVRGTKARW